MVKLLKRTTDNKFLSSLSGDTWVESRKEAFEMTYSECEEVKTELLNTYTTEQIKEVVDVNKTKLISDAEKQILAELVKNSKQ